MKNVNSARPTLTYDGRGINGPDEYRSRIATFPNASDAEAWGPLFAASPDLLAACVGVLRRCTCEESSCAVCAPLADAVEKAKGK